MNIWGAIPNLSEAANVKSANKSAVSLSNYNGPSFAESIRDIARSVNMQVAGASTASGLRFNRKKEGLTEEPFSFIDAEEEMLEDCISRIKKTMQDFPCLTR